MSVAVAGEESRDGRECTVTIRIHIYTQYKTSVVYSRAGRVYADIVESEESFLRLDQPAVRVPRRKQHDERRTGRRKGLCAVQTCG